LASSDVLVISCVAVYTAVADVFCDSDVAAGPTAVDVRFVQVFSMFLASMLLLAFLRLLAVTAVDVTAVVDVPDLTNKPAVTKSCFISISCINRIS